MAQPPGRVCSLLAKYRTYLRSSPLLCAADCLSILIRLAPFSSAFPFKDAIRLLVHERFGDVENEDEDEEGIHAIEKLTFVRWMFFVFGTLGPGIKLLAMEGVPWTKAWGTMFLVSFMMVEGLVILSWRFGEYEVVPESRDMEKFQRIKSKLSAIYGLSVGIAVVLHGLLLSWIIIDIQIGFHHKSFIIIMPKTLAQGVAVLLIETTLLVGVFYNGVLIIGWPISSAIDFIIANSRWKFEITTALVLWLSVVLALFLAYISLDLPGKNEFFVEIVVDWCFLLALSAPALLVYIYLEPMAKSFPRLAKSVFITLPKPGKRVRQGAVMKNRSDLTYWCFMMFLYSTVLCVIWYAYRYNPEGTVNRGWTGVFG